MEPKRKPVKVIESYDYLGTLSEKEVEAILEQRPEPKLGTLSSDEVTLVLEMRGGVLHRAMSALESKKKLKAAIIDITSKYPQTIYDIEGKIEDRGFLVRSNTLTKVLKKLEEKGFLLGEAHVAAEDGWPSYNYRATDLGKHRYLKGESG